MKISPVFLISLSVFLGGCQMAPGPAVSLVDLQLTQATAFETTAAFTLRLSNESPEPVQLTGGVYKIYVNGLYVGEGLTGDSMDLPRLGTATQTVTVHLSNLRLLTRLRPILESKCFDYRLKVILYGKPPAGTMRSESEGRLDARDFPLPPVTPSSRSLAPMSEK
ncbi:MAG: LEA type 2 family protein [Opitutaceae bacterium]|nr:LEA type 2 family protein [Opitutaceae bacterium]